MKLFKVYDAYQTELEKFAFSLCRQHEDAEDYVHQAYLKALEQYELFENMHDLQIKGWLFTTIKRLFVDVYRKQRRVIYTDDMVDIPFHANIDSQIITEDLIKQLPEHCRAVVYMRYIEGYNSTEISQILNINASTVRSRLSQALKILREELTGGNL